MSRKLIMLIGNTGAGKATAANILRDYKFNVIKFSSPINDFAVSLGFNHNHVYGTPEQKEITDPFYKITPYEFMQKFKTDICNNEIPKKIKNMDLNNHNLIIRAAEHKILNNDELLCIEDGSNIDEANLVRKYNGIIIKLVRNIPDVPINPTNSSIINPTNSSIINPTNSSIINPANDKLRKIEEVKCDYVIHNNDSMKHLENKLRDVLVKEEIHKLTYADMPIQTKLIMLGSWAVFVKFLLFL